MKVCRGGALPGAGRLLLASAAAVALGGGLEAQLSFVDSTQRAGIEHEYICGAPGENLCDIMGGAAAADFDRDGWTDLFLLGGGRRADRMLRNRGDGTFEDVSAAWGVDGELHLGSGCAVGDVNGDGWQDLFVTSVGEPGLYAMGRHRLYMNMEGERFEERAEEAGLRWTATVWPDGFGATFGDVDRDGDLDLFVAGWRAVPSPSLGNRLFENQGDGTFVDVTGVTIDIPEETHGFTPIFADMDGDLWPELLLASDFYTSRYYVNAGGAFVETTGPSGLGLDGNGMGACAGDLDGDGLPEWFVTSIFDPTPLAPTIIPGDGNKLYRNLGRHQYEEVAEDAGVARSGWGWGTVMADLDNDGLRDLVAVNGFVHPDHLQEYSRVWHNKGQLRFEDVTRWSGFEDRNDVRGLLQLDHDRDGDRDLLLIQQDGAPRLFENTTTDDDSTSWVEIRLDARALQELAPDGIGARVEVRAAGGVGQVQQMTAGGGYLTASPLELHFGLGDARGPVEVIVTWPSGQVDHWSGLGIDRRHVLCPL